MDTKDWSKRREINTFIQDLNIQYVDEFIKDNKTRGQDNIKTWTIIYLNEYEKTKLSNDILRVLLINPSTEKIFKEFASTAIFVLIVFISSEKQISLSKRFFPSSLIAKDMYEFKSNIISIIKNEKFKISKITHEFYNRQKALELLVKQNINNDSKIQKSNVSKNVLNIINSLTEEYSEEFNSIKELPKLESTGITEIDGN